MSEGWADSSTECFISVRAVLPFDVLDDLVDAAYARAVRDLYLCEASFAPGVRPGVLDDPVWNL